MITRLTEGGWNSTIRHPRYQSTTTWLWDPDTYEHECHVRTRNQSQLSYPLPLNPLINVRETEDWKKERMPRSWTQGEDSRSQLTSIPLLTTGFEDFGWSEQLFRCVLSDCSRSRDPNADPPPECPHCIATSVGAGNGDGVDVLPPASKPGFPQTTLSSSQRWPRGEGSSPSACHPLSAFLLKAVVQADGEDNKFLKSRGIRRATPTRCPAPDIIHAEKSHGVWVRPICTQRPECARWHYNLTLSFDGGRVIDSRL